jgi:hypothetical protein
VAPTVAHRQLVVLTRLDPATAIFARACRFGEQDTKCRTEAPITKDHVLKRTAETFVVACQIASPTDTNPDDALLTGKGIDYASPAG